MIKTVAIVPLDYKPETIAGGLKSKIFVGTLPKPSKGSIFHVVFVLSDQSKIASYGPAMGSLLSDLSSNVRKAVNQCDDQ